MRSLHQLVVGHVYATHNNSRQVREALSRFYGQVSDAGLLLNVGSGVTSRRKGTINLDVALSSTVDCVASGDALPFRSGHFAGAVSQEVLEHVPDPSAVLLEIKRVLRPGGYLYCQLPFIIGYHPGPNDYWRFTVEGIRQIVLDAGLEIVESGMSVGPATGFYRVVVEFVASFAGALFPSAYRPAKGAAAIAFMPLKILDPLLSRSREANRLAGGYFVIARKSRD